MTIRTVLFSAGVGALLALPAGIAAAQQPKMPSGIDPKTCSYNACIRACIQTRMPNCDQACLRCPVR